MATLALVTLAVSALTALAASHHRSHARPHAFQHWGARPPAAKPKRPPRALVTAAQRRERHARRAERRARSTRAGRQALRRSATAYGGLEASEALAAERAGAPSAIGAPVWRPITAGQRVESYLDDNTAVVAAGTSGQRALVQSTLPLRAPADGGRRAPVDLSLQDRGSSLEPANPIVTTRIADRAAGGVALPDVGITVTPVGASTAAAATEVAGKAFYANVQRDTDELVQPIPNGAETSTLLRSADSPRDLAFRVALPDGAALQPSQRIRGGFEVARGSDVLAEITPAYATDADGLPVHATTRVNGDTLLTHVSHRSGAARYPVTVDPAIVEDFRDWRTNTALDFNGWGFVAYPSTKFQYWYGNAYLGNGLYEYSHTQYAYNYGDYAEWYFNVLGFGNAFIYRADFDNTIHEAQGTCIIRGIYSRATSSWESGYWSTLAGGAQSASPSTVCSSIASPGTNQVHCIKSDCSPAGDVNNLLGFVLYASSTATRTYFTGYLGGAAAYEYDFVTPAMTQTGIPSGWVENPPTTTMSVTADDNGMGSKSIALDSPTDPGWDQATSFTSPCTGPRNARCPETLGLNFTAGSMTAEGRHTIRAVGTGIVGRQGTGTWDLKLDRTAPALTLTGAIAAGGRYVDDPGDLHVLGTDGSTSSPSAERSGMKSLVLTVDGQPQGPPAQSCPQGSCQMSYDYTLPAEGQHSVSVDAADQLDHHSTHDYGTFIYDKAPPQVTLSGTLWDARGDYAPINGALHVDASDGTNDGNPADTRSGVKSIEVQVDGVQKSLVSNASPCDNCALASDFTYHAADYSPGDHTVSVIATDEAGHANTQSFVVTTDDVEPDVGMSGTLWDSDQKTISESSYDLEIDAGDGDATEDPGTGVKSIEVQVDGNQVFFDSQECPDGNCDLADSWTFQTSSYSDGPHVIDVYVTDQAGNVDQETETVDVQQQQSQPSQSTSTSTAANRELVGEQPGDRAGQSVADIGDVNGDDIDDYAIGAPGASPMLRSGAGKVYVVYGRAGTTPPTPEDLGAATATGGYTISGATPGDQCGSAVASAGDVNGDGFDDLLVGCPGTSGGTLPTTGQGHVYVIFGGATVTSEDLTTLGSGGFVIAGPIGSSGGPRPFGSYLQSARTGAFGANADVNGDDLEDVAIGWSGDSPNGRTESGATYVVFGKTDTLPVDTTNMGTAGFRIDGAAPGDHSGYAAAIVGDTNGDDLADIAVTAPDANYSGRTAAGTAYLVFGKSDTADVDLATLGVGGYPIYGNTGDALGSSVAAVGDVDGDSLEDIAIGGHGAHVVFGQDADTNPVDLAAPDLAYALTAPPGSGYDGSIVAGGGDLNDDGLGDVLVGFPNAPVAGTAFAILSQEGIDPTSAPIDLGNLPGQLGTQIAGTSSGDAFGTSLDGLDAGGDGDPALVAGAPRTASASGSSAGAAYVVSSNAFAANSKRSSRAEICCWKHTYAYPFNDPLKDFPTVYRYTHKKNRDETHHSSRYGWHNGARYKHKPPYGGNVRRKFRKGKYLNGFAKTPVYDSTEQKLGYLQQNRRPHDHFSLYNTTDANPVLTTPHGSHAKLLLETTPCITTDNPKDDPGRFALFSVQGSGPVAGLRVLIKRSDLPDHAFNKSLTNDQVIDAGWISCHRPFKHVVSNPLDYGFPSFVDTDKYQGNHVAEVCESKSWKPKPISRFNPDCGTAYWNYEFPRNGGPGSIPGFPDTVLVSASSTGVGKGGISRAVFALPAYPGTLSMRERDYINYVDPNVPCEHNVVGHWHLARYKGLYGWLATREPGYKRDHSHSSNCNP